MKNILAAIVLTGILSLTTGDDIYSLSLKDIDGTTINLSAFRNKRMLFVVAPLSDSDTSLPVSQLSALATQYRDSLIIFGVPAEELGYMASDKDSIKAIYSSMPSNFILAEGMKVKKSSGAEQAAIFQWLTDISKNKRFNTDVLGTGQKFFVDERGILYGVLGSQLKLSNPLINRIISKSVQ